MHFVILHNSRYDQQVGAGDRDGASIGAGFRAGAGYMRMGHVRARRAGTGTEAGVKNHSIFLVRLVSLSFLLEAILERRVCALVPDISQYSLSKKNITYDNGRSSLKVALP